MSNPTQPQKRSKDLVVVVAVVVAVGLVSAIFWTAKRAEGARRQDSSAISNLRQLQAGADQYFLVNGVSSVASTTIVSTAPGAMIPSWLWQTVAQETYTPVIVQGAGITASGIAGARTVTYGP